MCTALSIENIPDAVFDNVTSIYLKNCSKESYFDTKHRYDSMYELQCFQACLISLLDRWPVIGMDQRPQVTYTNEANPLTQS